MRSSWLYGIKTTATSSFTFSRKRSSYRRRWKRNVEKVRTFLNVENDGNYFMSAKKILLQHLFHIFGFVFDRNVMKGGSNDPGLMQQGQSTHTLPHQHHYQHQKQHSQQHATLPRATVIQEMSMQVGWKFTVRSSPRYLQYFEDPRKNKNYSKRVNLIEFIAKSRCAFYPKILLQKWKHPYVRSFTKFLWIYF